jgi:hypothetical protein
VKQPKLFEGRESEPKKVEWMDVLYPRVNGPEYHAFRKAHQNLTHHDYTITLVVKKFAGKVPSRDEIIGFLRHDYINNAWQAGDIEVQVAQYLGQLTLKGWNGLINGILKIAEGRKQ